MGAVSVVRVTMLLLTSLPLLLTLSHMVSSLVPGETSHWTTPYSLQSVEQCQELDRQLLENLQDGMLGDMCDDGEQCGRIIVTSMGPSAVKQPTRLGLYFLSGWNKHKDQEDK